MTRDLTFTLSSQLKKGRVPFKRGNPLIWSAGIDHRFALIGSTVCVSGKSLADESKAGINSRTPEGTALATLTGTTTTGRRATRWGSPIQFAIWIGLAFAVAGCSDCTATRAGSSAADSSGSENQPSASAPPLGEPYCIQITGSNYRWRVRYPDRDGRLDSPAHEQESRRDWIARDVHVPAQTDIVLVLKSDDYVYTLALPDYGLKEIAVPSLEFRMELHPPEAGTFPLLGDELCGDPHPELKGHLIVEPRDRFLQWLKAQ